MDKANKRFRQPERVKEQQLEDTRRRLAAYLNAPARAERRRTRMRLVVLIVAAVVAWRWWKATHGV